MTTLIDAEKYIWKRTTPFGDKTFNNLGMEETFYLIEAFYETLTAHIILNGDRLNTFKIWDVGKIPALITSIQHYNGDSNQNNQTRKRSKSHLEWKRSKTVSICI